MHELSDARVIVLGLGETGRSAATFCAEAGAHVTAADERSASELGAIDLPASVTRAIGVPFPNVADFDLVVPSPGVPPARYRSGAKKVWGDIEIASQALAIPVIAVTGTNGKSTVVRLLEAMLRASGYRARAAGNIGTPALDLVGEALDVAILELSSFQLETIDTFRPRVAVLLNFTPDHLDRHENLANYAAAKSRIFANQQLDDAAIVPGRDPASEPLTRDLAARRLEFGPDGPFEVGAWLDAGMIAHRDEIDGPVTRFALDGIRLLGAHNRDNLMAALCAAVAFGADSKRAFAATATFEGLAHRSQWIASVDGVPYINDSKATNPAAAMRSLEGFVDRVIWIAGGHAKELDLGPLLETARPRVQKAIALGEAAETICAALGDVAETADSIEDAVTRAHACASAGDVVLLAPGCSSLDQFENFEERGRRFESAVRALSPRRGTL